MGVQVLSYSSIEKLDSSSKIQKILRIVKKGDVVLIEGKLELKEETMLITEALKGISNKFSGVELAYLDSKIEKTFHQKFKNFLIKLLGGRSLGITVIGPSKIIKEIKMNPDNLEILF